MSGHEDDDDAGLVPVQLRAPGEPLRKSTNIFTSAKTPIGDTSDMSALSPLDGGDDVVVFGGAFSRLAVAGRLWSGLGPGCAAH